MNDPRRAARGALLPWVLMGAGLGAFLDGIVFHQVLRWHHLISAYEPGTDAASLERIVFWDGVFHLVAWVLVAAGVVLLALRRRNQLPLDTRAVAGAVLLGWGAFNVTDEVVFHLLLGAHHIRMVPNYWIYDGAYTLVSVALVVAGARLQRKGAVDPVPKRS